MELKGKAFREKRRSAFAPADRAFSSIIGIEPHWFIRFSVKRHYSQVCSRITHAKEKTTMPKWLTCFIDIGDRPEVYEKLLAGLPETPDYYLRERLDCALAVAGISPDAEQTLHFFWPREKPHQPLFNNARDYMPRILDIAAKSPHGRFRGHAIHIMPPVSRVEFRTWGFDDTTMPLPQRLMIAVKLGEPELFGALLVELEFRAKENQRSYFLYSPPLTLDYHIGPNGPFVYFPCGGKGDGIMNLTAEQLFQLLAVPAMADSDTHSRFFKAVIPKITDRAPPPNVSLDPS